MRYRKEKNNASINYELPIMASALFAGWISILITNFFGFSVVITQLLFYLIPAIVFVLHAYNQTYTPDTEASLKNLYRKFPLQWSLKQKKISILGVSTITILFVGTVILTWFSDKQFARGYNLSRAGYYPQAYQALSVAIQLNPLEPMFHDEQGTVVSTLALASFKENQATISQELADAAIKENDIALAISPNNVNFWKSRTKIFYTLSSINPTYIKNAIQALEKGLTLSPSDPKMYYNLAILYGQTGASDMPVTFMKKAIELKPNYREGYLGLSLLYKELHNTEESKQILKKYLQKVDPKDEEFQKMIQ
jgi:tetratricopeptide (TPR) repeat protein